MPRVMIGFKDVYLPDGPREMVMHEIVQSSLVDLMFGRASHFYYDAYRQGIIDESFDASYKADAGFAAAIIGAETADGERLVQAVEKTVARAKDDGFKGKEVSRVKKKIEGRVVKAFDSPGSAAALATELNLKGISYLDLLDLIDTIDSEDLEKGIERSFSIENRSVSTVRPPR
jgi:predicted Zn-dependent peptidase